jgi:hypothetical protein
LRGGAPGIAIALAGPCRAADISAQEVFMRIARVCLSFAVVCIAGLAVGCAGKSTSSSGSDVADENEANASSAQASRTEEALFQNVNSTDPNLAATQVASQWWPAGCVTRQKDATNPTVVHVHLNECTGPFGLQHWTGDITVTFTQNASGGLHAQAASSNMTVNGSPVTFSRDADITVNGTDRTATSTGAWTRTNARGETVSHSSNTTTVIDTVTHCRTTNGTNQTNVGLRQIDGSLTNYKVCRKVDGSDGCPSGTIKYTNRALNRPATIIFDGSAQAQVTLGSGVTEEVELVCVP